MRQARFSDQALADLAEIWQYIAGDNQSGADTFLSRILEKCKTLSESPGIGTAREQLGPALRSFPVGAYLIFYRPSPDGIEVARVLSGYRDYPRLFPTDAAN